MTLFARPDLVVPIVTAIIAAMATTLAAVLPVWMKLRAKLRAERLARKKGQGGLESDVDQVENRLELDQDRLKELEYRVELLERLCQPPGEDNGSPVPNPSPNVPLPPGEMVATGNLKGRAKRAYLVGADAQSRSVQRLVKVHDYMGKAIYAYEFRTRKWGKEADSSTPDIDAKIAQYSRIGHEIDHPGNIRLDDAPEWIAHARREAKKLGLSIDE